MTEILVLCPFGMDTGLVSQAARMGKAVVFVPKEDVSLARECGAARIHILEGEKICDEGDFASFLAEKIRLLGYKIILAPATVKMRNVMPYLASLLGAALTADCTSLLLEGESLLQTRPAFGNSLMATIRSLSPIQMATVRPGTFPSERKPVSSPEVFTEIYQSRKKRIQALNFTPFPEKKPLSEANIIVAGGQGIGSKEGFETLSLFAKKIGASLGASRTAVDNGFAPFHCQVGMTGVTVSPRLYIAVGISGAVQHLAGMTGSEKIIAINSDPKAAIFEYADYGFVGPWQDIIQI
ncbi:MAG: electron transfer flavoprotein subunit alpha/FixB family protein [Clostridia bacterium]|nr:electron transfer flavoprotein subunit alpha/FixB family protein [Clostridia bacterium]